ncbi:MAG TPA: hypothetical protein VF665_13940, partial [Longimicrobium sp.]|uniref:hypothetical protein n=1 Tax=Longimicrobium sp. TaxID=2029185 RepID=UPI002EDB429E
MARITLDIFSGRPNPSWVLDEKQARDLLQDLQRRPEALAPADAFPGILGYRGILVESEYEGAKPAVAEFGRALPAAFRLGSGRARDNARSFEFAERLLSGLGNAAPAGGAEDAGPSYDKMNLRALIQRQMADASTSGEFTEAPTDAQAYSALLAEPATAEDSGTFTAASAPSDGTASADLSAAAACWNPATVIGRDASTWVTQTVGSCSIEAGAFNPSFWNSGLTLRNNNCYNYATNRRTDTFAQPGRATCAGTSVMACNTVGAGAQSDGALLAPTCAASGSAPRWYMALVIAPGYDYHWYRKASAGYWGHKPGSTAA